MIITTTCFLFCCFWLLAAVGNSRGQAAETVVGGCGDFLLPLSLAFPPPLLALMQEMRKRRQKVFPGSTECCRHSPAIKHRQGIVSSNSTIFSN